MALRIWCVSLSLVAALAACTNSSGSSSSSSGGNAGLCSLDTDCATGEHCRGGLCLALECTTTPDCLSPLKCVEGECITVNNTTGQCTVTADCPMPYLCDGFSRRCFNADTGEFLGGSSSGGSSGATSGSTSTSHASGSSSSSSSSSGGLVDLTGWRLKNEETGDILLLPSGTLVPRGGLLVVGRDSSKAAFETHWHTTLPSNVVYLNSGGPTAGVPIINGGEKFGVFNQSNARKDGPTITGVTDTSYRRTQAANPGAAGSWTQGADTTATPGVTALPSGTTGVLVSEWSDAPAPGDYVYEFIEIYVNP